MEVKPSLPYAGMIKHLTKQGGIFSPEPEDVETAQEVANRMLWRAVLSAFALGGLTRGAFGAARLFKRQEPTDIGSDYQPIMITLEPEDTGKDKSRRKSAMAKQAQSDQPPFAGAFNWLTNLTSRWPTEGPWGQFFGASADNWAEVPAVWAIGLPASAAALYGGWKLADNLLDTRRKAELETELERAKNEYQQLIQNLRKEATDTTIEAELEDLYALAPALTEKRASLAGLTSLAASVLLGYMTLTALAAGSLGYKYMRSNNPKSITEEALRKRERERRGGTTPIYLAPIETF